MKKKVMGMLVIVFIFSFAFYSTTGFAESTKIHQFDYNKLQVLGEILSRIKADYVDINDVDYNKMLNDILKASVDSLGDKFSYYMTPFEINEMNVSTESNYGGLGMVVTWNPDKKAVEIVSPMFGSPAWKAGLKAKDLIISVNSSPTSEMGLNKSVSIMRGKIGTTLKLTILRGTEKINVEVTRAKIEIKTVKETIINKNNENIGYIRITEFSRPTAKEFQQALEKLSTENINGLIIDLRNDPGGLLSSVIDVASLIIPNGEKIVSIKYRSYPEEIDKSYSGKYSKIPLVVLVNGGSASAAEILTGAVKDNKRGVIIGEKTYGKGSVQSIYPLSNGGALRLTIAYYYTPAGIKINKIGIEPNITVKAQEYSKEELEKMYNEENESMTTDKVYLDYTDPQLKAALQQLQKMINLPKAG
jgi:carboxyl-terminal processing protease